MTLTRRLGAVLNSPELFRNVLTFSSDDELTHSISYLSPLSLPIIWACYPDVYFGSVVSLRIGISIRTNRYLQHAQETSTSYNIYTLMQYYICITVTYMHKQRELATILYAYAILHHELQHTPMIYDWSPELTGLWGWVNRCKCKLRVRLRTRIELELELEKSANYRYLI